MDGESYRIIFFDHGCGASAGEDRTVRFLHGSLADWFGPALVSAGALVLSGDGSPLRDAEQAQLAVNALAVAIRTVLQHPSPGDPPAAVLPFACVVLHTETAARSHPVTELLKGRQVQVSICLGTPCALPAEPAAYLPRRTAVLGQLLLPGSTPGAAGLVILRASETYDTSGAGPRQLCSILGSLRALADSLLYSDHLGAERCRVAAEARTGPTSRPQYVHADPTARCRRWLRGGPPTMTRGRVHRTQCNLRRCSVCR